MTEIERLQHETGIAIDAEHLPRHIAIIMDGNGRWATSRGLVRIEGHREGYRTVRTVVTTCGELGVEALTLYTFSTENWRRPREEVETVMQLIELATLNELPEMMKNNVRLRTSGDIDPLSKSLKETLSKAIDRTSKNTGLILNLAINYGGRSEILDAVREACRQVREGEIGLNDVTEEYFSGLLYTGGLPDPDLLIRTAGELRVSNFLLWQIAYTEIWVTSTLWPDFGKSDLMQAIADYQKRIRKFGSVV